ncbi:DUF4258 domain-containing protein [Thiohalocapsa marina]|uniref:DUF4258 domain-containing protein n=1 Tax=Thiohalocapsa marina TaxID=424902 RepID=A0A5M8FH53_9GAMM|nr:DUF4258 domain-containing protein [Thiohalocapsa marina]KAA6184208.1 DUF4258 domain-containing protein [Thiohalocapsa marina]
MEYVLTDHARKRCARRGIALERLDRVLTYPTRTEPDADDPSLVHARLPVPERAFRERRVIYNERRDPVANVTAYFDDGVNDL